mmetsp:Transcript_106831/g.230029  ORF Transcript_106831/g.230029 Transcript_106831/m.230029 type:complete len:88 (+) Transcript_106831:80-343(+)
MKSLFSDKSQFDSMVKNITIDKNKVTVWVELSKDFRKFKSLVEEQMPRSIPEHQFQVKLVPQTSAQNSTVNTLNADNLKQVKNIISV